MLINHDPYKWPVLRPLLVVPRWLGGAHTVQYIMRHKWCHWAILWPLIKLRAAVGKDGGR